MNNIDKHGNVYELGKIYIFWDDDGFSESVGYLTEVRIDEPAYPFHTDDSYYENISVINTDDLGTITPPKVKFIQGDCYSFIAVSSGIERRGFYDRVGWKGKPCFICTSGAYTMEECTNIKHLT